PSRGIVSRKSGRGPLYLIAVGFGVADGDAPGAGAMWSSGSNTSASTVWRWFVTSDVPNSSYTTKSSSVSPNTMKMFPTPRTTRMRPVYERERRVAVAHHEGKGSEKVGGVVAHPSSSL